MKEKLISVIVPVYNVIEYLDDCVNSLCHQEYQNIEIILVDDGSTDGSSERCDIWNKLDNRIVVIHKQNGGLSSARNVGLDIAKGEFIAFVDSDDMVEKNIYSCLMAVMKQKKCDIVGCSYKSIEEDGTLIPESLKGVDEGYLTREQYLTEYFHNMRKHMELVVVWNKLYRREIIDNIQFLDGSIHEDDFFLNDTLFRMNSFYFIPEELCLYRMRDNSITHSPFSEKRLDHYYALRQRLELCLMSNVRNECVILLADNLVIIGIRFWLMLEYFQLMDKEGRLHFYNDVLSYFDKYGSYELNKGGIMRWMFKHNPVFLAQIYRIHKQVKKK